MAMTMAFVFAVTVFLVVIIALGMLAVVTPVVMLLFVTWRVFAVVPVVLHEINALATGVVARAMLAPVFGVTGRLSLIHI